MANPPTIECPECKKSNKYHPDMGGPPEKCERCDSYFDEDKRNADIERKFS